ncbi:hypothetical protein B0O99DRAFT_748537 [Bisporella sp. PMI_857]|nr:hypothetical protein B0O99DRAFT_748537 [Bisporella sp. PMI_857]
MDDRRSQIVWLNSAFMAVSIISVTIRLLTRIFLIKLLGADDVHITVALFLALAHASCFIIATTYGEGLHIQYLKPANVPAYTKVMLLSGFFNCLCQMFIRLSYLTFYLRLAVTKNFRVILYISIVLVSGFGIATSIVSMTLCIPFTKLWNPHVPGHCVNIKAYYIAVPALNMIFDIAIFILPIPLLWALKLPRRQRISLVAVFAVGLIVVIASILRLHTLVLMLNTPAYRSDNTWSTVDSLNWSTVEVHLAILISCTPAFKALIQRFLPGILGSLSATRQNLSRNQHTYSTQGGGYLRQSRSRDNSNFESVIRESNHDTTENGSQEHIIEDVELSGCNTTLSVRATSETSIDYGVIEGRLPVGST